MVEKVVGDVDLTILIYRIIGAALGTAVGLMIVPPISIRNCFSRSAVGVVGGAVAAFPLRQYYLHWEQGADTIIPAAALAGFGCWWFMGGILAAIRKFTNGKNGS